MKKIITPTILLLSIVSLLTDVSSEMLYPVMPLFLQSIGFSTIIIGVLEGFAEAIAGISKIYFGRISDSKERRMPFVRMGYFLSSISKPMMAVFSFPLWIFLARTIDRLGKGIRTGARDAILSDETTPENKGTVFGFHRALDTSGAALGPFVALIFLQYHPGKYAPLFLIAFIPATLSLLLTLVIRERHKTIIIEKGKSSPAEKFFYWRNSSLSFRKLMVALLFFGLINSSDVFLLLRAKTVAGNDSSVLIIYIFYNIVFALFSLPAGRLSDKIGMKKMITAGFIIFAVAYGGMAFTQNMVAIAIMFFLYGIYAAATEGISKALISNIVPKSETASAIGFYTGWNSIAALIASSVAGIIWYKVSPEATFALSAAGAMLTAILLGSMSLKERSAVR
ncbi:MAG: MFS transporter [Chitinophagales bacterium]|nr:MFS transporter [Chitinophagales bacterium]